MHLRVSSHHMCTLRYLFCLYEYERGVDQRAAETTTNYTPQSTSKRSHRCVQLLIVPRNFVRRSNATRECKPSNSNIKSSQSTNKKVDISEILSPNNYFHDQFAIAWNFPESWLWENWRKRVHARVHTRNAVCGVWFQCATCCEAAWRRFLGRRARTPPPTCKAFATPWRSHIWRPAGTIGSDGRAASSTFIRIPPRFPRYVQTLGIIPSSTRREPWAVESLRPPAFHLGTISHPRLVD